MALKPNNFFDTQEMDCCGDPNLICNDIEIIIEDGGGGPYLVIKTSRWALNDEAEIDAFADQLKRCLALAEGTDDGK